jgi:signal transduction histidine kinase
VKILIAEDNRFYRCMLEATLLEWGYEVLATSDGEEAWQVLREKAAPPLAILDWMMPGLDGVTLCKRVRALQRAEPTYIILLTAKDGKENVIAGLQGGADDYINKPFDREELRARLQVGLRIVGLQSNLAARVAELQAALSGAQKMEAVGRLAGGVAHDFNNLLTIINGFSEVLLAKLGPGDEDYDAIHTIRQAGERGAGLTRQLLAFSRKQVLTPVVLNLNTLVANTEKMLRRLIGEDVRLLTCLDSDLHPVKADPGQVEQVIMNLAVNARDAMPQGGEVVIETRNVELDEGYADAHPGVRPGGHVLLEVRDTGCGMDEPTKARLFEPFFTTKEPGKGTGLGLATVYGIVNQSDGHITVQSEPGRGATFQIYLPQVTSCVPQPPPGLSAAGPVQGAETVLLVEDEEDVRKLARHVLQANHYRVLEAADGSEALQVSAAWHEPIHLLVTDVFMPTMSGRQLADRLTPLRPNLKILYMSGYTDDAIVRHRVLEPGNHFLQKPFTPRDLACKVREVLGGTGGSA